MKIHSLILTIYWIVVIGIVKGNNRQATPAIG